MGGNTRGVLNTLSPEGYVTSKGYATAKLSFLISKKLTNLGKKVGTGVLGWGEKHEGYAT